MVKEKYEKGVYYCVGDVYAAYVKKNRDGNLIFNRLDENFQSFEITVNPKTNMIVQTKLLKKERRNK